MYQIARCFGINDMLVKLTFGFYKVSGIKMNSPVNHPTDNHRRQPFAIANHNVQCSWRQVLDKGDTSIYISKFFQ